MQSQSTHTIHKCLLLVAAIAVTLGPLLAPTVLAQQAPRAAATSATKATLDSLDPGDEKLMAELARLGLEDLLSYSFTRNNVRLEDQRRFRVFSALGELGKDGFLRLPAAVQKQKIQDIIDGMEAILPNKRDPEELLKYAAQLIVNGTSRLVNLLEYWGENEKTQAQLNPIAETVDKILRKAIAEAKSRADDAIKGVKVATPALMQKWERLDQIEKLARYNWGNASYGLALSYDRANPKRKQVCKEATDAMTEFAEEGSSVRMPTLLTIAKLTMAAGDYPAAARQFEAIMKLPQTDNPKVPAKFAVVHYEARYFHAVTHLLAREDQEAEQALNELNQWLPQNVPAMARLSAGSEAQAAKLTEDLTKSTEAASDMLKYRIAGLRAELAQDPAQREKFNAEAIGVLMDLVSRRPDLRGIIFEQVMNRLPERPEMAKLDPLLLEAILTRGMQAALRRGEHERDDARNIDLATDAAREIVKRQGQPGIRTAQVDNAALYTGVLEESLAKLPGVPKAEVIQSKQDAGEAYLYYVEHFPQSGDRAVQALDQALAVIVWDLHKSENFHEQNDAEQKRTTQLYDAALKIATQLGRNEYCYQYGVRLKELNRFKEAAIQFRQVPRNDKAPLGNLWARYWEMFCLQQHLTKDANVGDAERQQLVGKIVALVDEVNAQIEQLSTGGAMDAKQKERLARMRAQTTLMAADTARASGDASRVESLLQGFEEKIKDLPDREEFLSESLFMRTNALFQQGKNDQGVAALRQYVGRRSGDEAARLIGQFLYKLNEDYLAAKGRNDGRAMDQLVLVRATLSGLLIEQVRKNPNHPNRREYLYFNAKAQQDAAQRQRDPAARKQLVAEAVNTYVELLKDAKKDTAEESSLVRQIALAQFDLGNYKDCYERLRGLFAAKKFGTPLVRTVDAETGLEESKPNNMFWEGLHRLLKSATEISKQEGNDEKRAWAAGVLKDFLIEWGDKIGGTGWRAEFVELHKDLLPDWQPPSLGPSASQPATAPTK